MGSTISQLLSRPNTITGLSKLIVIAWPSATANSNEAAVGVGGRSAPTGSVAGEVTLERTPLAAARHVPVSIIDSVFRSGCVIVLGNAARDWALGTDPYLAAHAMLSVLAVPIRRGDRTLGVVYFENDLATDAFTPARVDTAWKNNDAVTHRIVMNDGSLLMSDDGANLIYRISYSK